MAIAPLIQSNSKNAGSVTSTTLAYTTDNAAGNMLVCCVRFAVSGIVITVTDSQGNTWVEADDLQGGSTGVWIFYAKNCASGPNTVTISATGVAAGLRCAVAEYAGADTTAPYDVSSTATGTGTLASVPLTTLSDGVLLVLCLGVSTASVATAGSGQYTVEEQQGNFFAFVDGFGLTAGNETGLVNLATSCTWLAVMVAFKPQIDAASPKFIPQTRHRVYEFLYEC